MDMNAQLEGFLLEMGELLTEVEDAILEVENSSDSQSENDAVNRLFRAMHSIKGIAGMFGFDLITDFTHHVESALDLVRNGELPVSKELINLVLRSHDLISELLDSTEGETELPDTGHVIISSLTDLIGSNSAEDSENETNNSGKNKEDCSDLNSGTLFTYRITFKPNIEFFESGNSIEELLTSVNELGDVLFHPDYSSLPIIDDLNPEQCLISWELILTTKCDRNAICDIFIFAEDHCSLEITLIDEIGDSQDTDDQEYKRLGEILVDRGAISKDTLNDVLSESSRIGDILVDKHLVEPKDVESALVEQKQVRNTREKRNKAITNATIRVQAQKLDSLVSLVGELVTAQARLTSVGLERNDSEINDIAETLENLVSGLRDETMSIRMVPIDSTFTTFKRLVRDLSGELGKEINLNMLGGDTELDKTVIERLKDPLVHIVRNSVDHGIESTGQREKLGKNRVGNLTLKAEHAGAFVQITVEDDGAGLNLKRIKEKAVERGLITPEAQLSDQEISMLVFAPGFSTADTVTDISGRGVGMDVVKQNIEALRGSIAVDTKLGEGTKIILRLPLTLAIIDGLMVQVAGEYYIIPLSMVEECMDLDMAEVEKIKGRNIINLRGKALPFVKLRDSLLLEGDEPSMEQVVITSVNGMEVGFVVDHVIGSHQTVIKSLGPGLRQAKHISGATILGDGTVALILDVQKLV